MILDPVAHNIYVPAALWQPAPVGARGRPQSVPDSFTVLVYGMNRPPSPHETGVDHAHSAR
jgi:hypothetical protein